VPGRFMCVARNEVLLYLSAFRRHSPTTGAMISSLCLCLLALASLLLWMNLKEDHRVAVNVDEIFWNDFIGCIGGW